MNIHCLDKKVNYLTKRQALHSMNEFILLFYFIPSLKDKNDFSSYHGTEYICDLLSNINTNVWADKSTADPGCWFEWEESINKALKQLKETETEDGKISLKVAFIAMRKFIQNFYSYVKADDLLVVLYDTRFLEGELVNKEIWDNYLQAVKTVLMDTDRYK